MLNITDTLGGPLLQQDVNGTPFRSLFGRPIIIAQALDNLGASKTPLLFGDFVSGYTFRQGGQMVIKKLSERYAEFNETAFVAFARSGGYSTNAGVPPIVKLVMAAS
jgi:HK97 family phage major capsid protein